ncbi:transcription factor TFIIIB complex subunit bdp1 [Schizosaccharomyces japonicus yFS275]|uniref:Transcription factor TFIIIB complex subunit bdp1 n=1 Tax=Schizosaccharomyces japonicus (strain yFS275 / FY16936) TaxID=402676 RepID=B6K325_SCHJY|nr:transcription factor TFIIIB complex subunit bdp1 [Schizosaccharomyces japonicus yFS275]EEB07882.2 transcription factor TFIIIB complex subunit bdp1 [Schizosaccharomyces japonicus yFS275]
MCAKTVKSSNKKDKGSSNTKRTRRKLQIKPSSPIVSPVTDETQNEANDDARFDRISRGNQLLSEVANQQIMARIHQQEARKQRRRSFSSSSQVSVKDSLFSSTDKLTRMADELANNLNQSPPRITESVSAPSSSKRPSKKKKKKKLFTAPSISFLLADEEVSSNVKTSNTRSRSFAKASTKDDAVSAELERNSELDDTMSVTSVASAASMPVVPFTRRRSFSRILEDDLSDDDDQGLIYSTPSEQLSHVQEVLSSYAVAEAEEEAANGNLSSEGLDEPPLEEQALQYSADVIDELDEESDDLAFAEMVKQSAISTTLSNLRDDTALSAEADGSNETNPQTAAENNTTADLEGVVPDSQRSQTDLDNESTVETESADISGNHKKRNQAARHPRSEVTVEIGDRVASMKARKRNATVKLAMDKDGSASDGSLSDQPLSQIVSSSQHDATKEVKLKSRKAKNSDKLSLEDRLEMEPLSQIVKESASQLESNMAAAFEAAGFSSQQKEDLASLKISESQDQGFPKLKAVTIPRRRKRKRFYDERIAGMTPEERETQQIDPTVFKMAQLCEDIGIGRRSQRFRELEKLEQEERIRKRRAAVAKREGSETPVLSPLATKAPEPSVAFAQEPEEEVVGTIDGIDEDQQPDLQSQEEKKPVRLSILDQMVVKMDSERSSGAGAATAVRTRVVDGKIVLDETSLEVDRHANEALSTGSLEVVEESALTRRVTSATWGRKQKSEKWDAASTEQFYKALSQWGTDFSLIANLFPGRTRRQIKLKFNIEERRNPKRVNFVLNNPTPVDMEEYTAVSGRVFRPVEDVESELASLRQEFKMERQRAQEMAKQNQAILEHDTKVAKTYVNSHVDKKPAVSNDENVEVVGTIEA